VINFQKKQIFKSNIEIFGNIIIIEMNQSMNNTVNLDSQENEQNPPF